jgi:hypothetical protein
MGLRQDGEAGKLSPGDLQLRQATGPICSLNEAWSRALDRCILDSPLSPVILPLIRSCFFGGAMHAVFLLREGHGDQLASDIASFIMEEPLSDCPILVAAGLARGTAAGTKVQEKFA